MTAFYVLVHFFEIAGKLFSLTFHLPLYPNSIPNQHCITSFLASSKKLKLSKCNCKKYVERGKAHGSMLNFWETRTFKKITIYKIEFGKTLIAVHFGDFSLLWIESIYSIIYIYRASGVSLENVYVKLPSNWISSDSVVRSTSHTVIFSRC